MKRHLTPDEQKLWEAVMAGARTLRGRKDEEMRREGDEEKKNTVKAQRETVHRNHPPISSSPHLPSSGYAGIDRNTSERFRKGKYPIDGTLDLHGLSREKAQAALYRFLHSHGERGSRCLLVITGKGMVLREALPHWLAGLQPMILAFDTAQPRHGGSGACYVLLRRKRHAGI